MKIMNPKTIHKIILTIFSVIAFVLLMRVGKVWERLRGESGSSPNQIKESESNAMEAAFLEREAIKIPFESSVAMELMPSGILLAGMNQVALLDYSGGIKFSRTVAGTISCMTVDADEVVYLCAGDKLVLLDGEGNDLGSFSIPGKNRLITGIAVSESNLFLADAMKKEVLRLNTDGELLNVIGGSRMSDDFPGFVIPSPFFDLNLDNFGNLWVANPGRHLLHHFDYNGNLVSTWGQASYALDGFCGCCNPTRFIILPDGSFVTVEKGLVRVKVYRPDGTFESLVAGPEMFDEDTVGLDLAISGSGAIMVMDPKRKLVRIFERKDKI